MLDPGNRLRHTLAVLLFLVQIEQEQVSIQWSPFSKHWEALRSDTNVREFQLGGNRYVHK